MVLNFIVMYSKATKTTTRYAVDVALRGGSEMLFYIEMGTLTIELSKTSFTVHELYPNKIQEHRHKSIF